MLLLPLNNNFDCLLHPVAFWTPWIEVFGFPERPIVQLSPSVVVISDVVTFFMSIVEFSSAVMEKQNTRRMLKYTAYEWWFPFLCSIPTLSGNHNLSYKKNVGSYHNRGVDFARRVEVPKKPLPYPT